MDAIARAIASFNENYIDEAFRTLESVFTHRFYPEVPFILREELDAAIEQAFDRIKASTSDAKYVIPLADKLTQAGLPVVQNGISDRELLRVLGIANPSYDWQWRPGMHPSRLVTVLTEELLDELQKTVRLTPFWEMRAVTSFLVWSVTEGRESKVQAGGARIELTRESKITGTPKQSLHLHNVNVYPYVTGCMVLRSNRRGFSNRKEVTINLYDKIAHGLKKTY